MSEHPEGLAPQLTGAVSFWPNRVPLVLNRVIKIAREERIVSHSREGESRRSETQRRHHAAKQAGRPSEMLDWLNEKTYDEEIQTALAGITVPSIATALGVSKPYATHIRAGRRIPHPRHWEKLVALCEIH